MILNICQNRYEMERRMYMESLENMYLEFTAEGICYLAALTWVKEIRESGVWEEDVPILDWEKIVGCQEENNCHKYGIILEHAGKRMGITAAKVAGVREVKEERLLELKEPVKNEKNRFISAAADLDEEGKGLAFVLNMDVLADLTVINSE